MLLVILYPHPRLDDRHVWQGHLSIVLSISDGTEGKHKVTKCLHGDLTILPSFPQTSENYSKIRELIIDKRCVIRMLTSPYSRCRAACDWLLCLPISGTVDALLRKAVTRHNTGRALSNTWHLWVKVTPSSRSLHCTPCRIGGLVE